MITAPHSIDRYLTRDPRIGALVYVTCVLAFLATAIFVVLTLAEQNSALDQSRDNLAWLESRPRLSLSDNGWSRSAMPAGSPLLQGQTRTVASAALLQRVTSAITRAGSNVVSSEVAHGGPSKDSDVKVVITCELSQESLQQLLYDLEAGMPFLFIDQLVVQASASQEGRMRILLAVYGQWQGEK